MPCSCIGYLVILHENYKYYALKVELELRAKLKQECGGIVTREDGVIHLFQ